MAQQPTTELARRLVIQAAWPTALVLACLLLMPIAFAAGMLAMATVAILVACVLLAFATIVLSALVLFDALLFRLAASHAHTEAGLAAVDDVLARMRLKPSPTRLRPMPERVSGTQRLLVRQRATCFLCVAGAVAAQFLDRL